MLLFKYMVIALHLHFPSHEMVCRRFSLVLVYAHNPENKTNKATWKQTSGKYNVFLFVVFMSWQAQTQNFASDIQ